MKIKFISILVLCLLTMPLQAQVDRSKMPMPGEAPQIHLGVPATFKLDNGLKVLVVENHERSKVMAKLIIDNKPYPEGYKAGTKALYAWVMGTGTQKIDKDAFNERIDFLGGQVNYNAEGAYASALTKYFPEVFGLMAKGLLHPKFTQTEFYDQKKRLIRNIKATQTSAKAVAEHIQAALTYGKHHPYGEFKTVETVKNVHLADVKSYYNNFITPKNAYLVVVGDITLLEVKNLVKKYFSEWIKTVPPIVSLPQVHSAQYTQINFVNMPNAVQSIIAVVNPIHLQKTSSDYFAALIANQILGGGTSGRLFTKLREDKGYTYSAHSSITDDKYVSRFKATTSVRNAVTDSAVIALLNEIKHIRNKKVTTQELQLAKAKYAGTFVRGLESPSAVADFALNIETENLPPDFYRNYLKHIDAVTVAEVQQAAQKYFKLNHARIVIVGNGPAVAPYLEQLTFNGKKLPVKYFNTKGERIEKPAYAEVEITSDTTNVGISAGLVYHKYIGAIGGEEAVQNVSSIYAKYTGYIGPRAITLLVKQTKDNKSLKKIEFGDILIQKIVFDGENGHVKIGETKRAFTSDELEAAKQQTDLFPELEVPETAKVAGTEMINGQKAYVVIVSKKKTNYYSVDSGLKLRTLIQTPKGAKVINYTKYKTVNGVKFPFEVSKAFGTQSIVFKAQEILVNQNVSTADFK